LAKRGSRTGATSLEGDRTNLIYLKHSKDSILWEQRPTPIIAVVEPKPKVKRKQAAPKPKVTKEKISAIRSEATSKQIEDLDGLIAKIIEPMSKSQIYKLAEEGGHGSAYLLRKHWKTVEERLVKNKTRYQQI
jgi:vancomycin resistance protein YoaR